MKNYVFPLHVQRILRIEEETIPDIVTKNESSFKDNKMLTTSKHQ